MSPLGRATKSIARKRATPRTKRCVGCLNRYVGLKCPVCSTRSTTKRGNIGKRCDALWSQIIKAPGKCFRCGAVDGLQAAHIIGRAQRVTRWTLTNGICLCHVCHRLFDTHRIDRQDTILEAIGVEAFVALRLRARGVWDKQFPLAELTARLQEVKRAN